MGSDLYMEQQNWRPRPTKVQWISDTDIKVERDAFYTGYFTVYEGKVTPEVKTLLKGLGVTIPEQPRNILHYDGVHKLKITGPALPVEDEAWVEEWYNSLYESIEAVLSTAGRDLMETYPDILVEWH